MDDITREKFLTIALVTCGAIFFTIYPLSIIWPSGWQWHSGHAEQWKPVSEALNWLNYCTRRAVNCSALKGGSKKD